MTFDFWTLGLQAVNALVLLWLLGRFFWRPVARMIEDRRTAVAQTLADADARLVQAKDALQQVEVTRAGFAAERTAILAAAQKDAEGERAAILAKAGAEVKQLTEAAEISIAKERRDAEAEWTKRAAQLAVDIAGKLLQDLGDETVRRAFADRLFKSLAGMNEQERRALADAGGRIEAVSAAPLASTEQAALHDRIAASLAAQPEITFRADPALIAGLELVGPHQIVRNSWQADLARILSELDHAQPH
ncbi:MAG: F0F1 ATP synthase subunit delta [Devosia sp.]|nr:F0F1 ATP synthase subunit delta [Devosia sp.]